MTLRELSNVFEQIESVASRNDVTAILAELFKLATVEESSIICYLLTGRIAPQFIDSEFNMSEKSVLKVLGDIAQRDLSDDRKELGDIGLVAMRVFEESRSQNRSEIELTDLYSKLWGVVTSRGSGSVAAKSALFNALIVDLSAAEVKMLCRIVVGKMRSGVNERTILDAISVALAGDKSLRAELDKFFGVFPDIGYVSYLAKSGIYKEAVAKIFPGVPVRPRLVERVKSFDDAVERMGEEFVLQPKFDGLRCQIHKGVDYSKFDDAGMLWANFVGNSAGEAGLFDQSEVTTGVRLFTRSLEDMTHMFPEVVAAVEAMPVSTLVLDGEIVGWDGDAYLPFQETIQRKRKHGVGDKSAEIPVRFMLFDVLNYEGQDLLEMDLSERIGYFERSVDDSVLVVSETRKCSSVEDVDLFFAEVVDAGLEGLIIKRLDCGYQPGTRNFEWIKLKKSMDKTLVDSVDLVIMGYYYGSGKRNKFGMGALLGGIYNEESGEIESVTKIGTGITDEAWGVIAARLKELEIPESPQIYRFGPSVQPDVWISPDVVCSVEADEISVSKVHFAARGLHGEPEQGLALRFPRLIEFDRDKNWQDATSAKELVRMAGLQVKG